MSKLPVSRVVSSSVNLSPAAAQSQSLADMLVLGASEVIDMAERMRTYASLAAVATDFGTTAPEYLAAVRWFAQSPQPPQIRIGRWAQTAAKGGLRCAPLTAAQQLLAAWTAIVAGSFNFTQDGGAVKNVTGLNFTGAANLNAVATIITAGIVTAGATAVCVWNPTYSRFEFQSPTTSAASAVSFLTAGGAGVSIAAQLGGLVSSAGAYVYQGSAIETIAAALAVFDDRFGQLFYGCVAPTGVTADQLSAAAYIEASGNKHIFGVTSSDPNSLVQGDTTCLGAQLQTLALLRTLAQYSSLDAYAAVSYLGRILTTNFNGSNTAITMKFKQEPGVASENLSVSQAAALESKNMNVFVQYANDTAIVEQGVQCNGTFTDVLTGTDLLALTIQTALYNQLYLSPTKIPQTDSGVGILQTAIEAVCAQGVINGLLAPGVWNSQGFGQLTQGAFLQKGYYVYAGSIGTQNASQRLARKAPPFQVAAKLAGAIHSADVSISVNQ